MRSPLATVQTVPANAGNWILDVGSYGTELVCSNSTPNLQLSLHDGCTAFACVRVVLG
jgi:hypothetical protein